jgi:hypothetical protein
MDDKWVHRKAIIYAAYREVLAGSHYLMGADGGVPASNGEGGGGLKGRKIKLLNIKEKDSIAIETAKYGSYLCHGRMSKVGGYELNMGKKENLYDYIKQYCPEETWCYGMTPRSKNWTTVMVGESCAGKRHFDCIFFVNWVLTNALMRPTRVTYNINQWSNSKIAPVQVLDKDKIGPGDILDADIFLNLDSSPQHIGFFAAGGMKIHASGANRGVITGDYDKSSFTHIVRLRDSFLKFG